MAAAVPGMAVVVAVSVEAVVVMLMLVVAESMAELAESIQVLDLSLAGVAAEYLAPALVAPLVLPGQQDWEALEIILVLAILMVAPSESVALQQQGPVAV